MKPSFRRWGLVAGLFAATAVTGWGYALLDSKWSTRQIVMYLQLGSSSGALLDGSASWDASAEDALATWNHYLANVQFTVVRNSSVTPADGDDVNNVFFDNTFYGSGFGSAVAITTEWTRNSGRTRIEADTVFNSNLDWNSYRGNLRNAAGGGTLYDLHRVALHEFGHTLGLDHPDDFGQTVTAIMNSRVSNIDSLQPDDIRGAQSIYGASAASSSQGLASFTRPRTTSAVTTSLARYTLRGHADPVQVNAVFVTNSRFGLKRFFKATGVGSWRLSLRLAPGRNVVRLYVSTPSALRVKVAKRVIIRTDGS
jgi:hypothetical protein